MKKISAVMITGFFFALITIHAFSQNALLIEPLQLSIGFYKTTNLIFPCAIKSVDRGSKDVLAQKARDVENILQVKAGKANFEETNLTVITSDGKLFSYLLKYSSNPAELNIQVVDQDTNQNTDAFFSPAIINEAVIEGNAKKAAGKKRTVYNIRDKNYGMKLTLNNLFIREDVVYCQVKIENSSNIKYDFEQFRFFIRDQKKSKRTAAQELELKPLYVFNNTRTVFDHSEHILVFALRKFTIPDKKYLTIQLMEIDGGRHLNLSVKNRHLMTARLINKS